MNFRFHRIADRLSIGEVPSQSAKLHRQQLEASRPGLRTKNKSLLKIESLSWKKTSMMIGNYILTDIPVQKFDSDSFASEENKHD